MFVVTPKARGDASGGGSSGAAQNANKISENSVHHSEQAGPGSKNSNLISDENLSFNNLAKYQTMRFMNKPQEFDKNSAQ